MNTDGTARGSVSVTDAANRDGEDLAAFAPDGKSIYLVSEGKASPIVRFGRTK